MGDVLGKLLARLQANKDTEYPQAIRPFKQDILRSIEEMHLENQVSEVFRNIAQEREDADRLIDFLSRKNEELENEIKRLKEYCKKDHPYVWLHVEVPKEDNLPPQNSPQ